MIDTIDWIVYTHISLIETQCLVLDSSHRTLSLIRRFEELLNVSINFYLRRKSQNIQNQMAEQR